MMVLHSHVTVLKGKAVSLSKLGRIYRQPVLF